MEPIVKSIVGHDFSKVSLQEATLQFQLAYLSKLDHKKRVEEMKEDPGIREKLHEHLKKHKLNEIPIFVKGPQTTKDNDRCHSCGDMFEDLQLIDQASCGKHTLCIHDRNQPCHTCSGSKEESKSTDMVQQGISRAKDEGAQSKGGQKEQDAERTKSKKTGDAGRKAVERKEGVDSKHDKKEDYEGQTKGNVESKKGEDTSKEGEKKKSVEEDKKNADQKEGYKEGRELDEQEVKEDPDIMVKSIENFSLADFLKIKEVHRHVELVLGDGKARWVREDEFQELQEKYSIEVEMRKGAEEITDESNAMREHSDIYS